MEETFFQKKSVQFVIRLATALSFLLFSAYQIYVALQESENRLWRLIGVGFYLLITLASFLDFSEKSGLWTAHSVLLVAGLVLLFGIRLQNIPPIFGALNFSDGTTVLNCGVYLFTQLGTLGLAVAYILLLADVSELELRKVVLIMMFVVIALYLIAFIMEIVLLLAYRANIELGLRSTLLSRCLYYMGFTGTAISFILPAPNQKKKHREGQFLYSEMEEDEIDLVI